MASEYRFDIMEQKRAEMQAEFLKLTPMERMEKMSAFLNDIIAAKANALGVSEYEVYSRYLEVRDQYYRRNQDMEPEDENQLLPLYKFVVKN